MSIGTVMMKQAELWRENEVNDRPSSVSKRELAGAAAATMIPGSQALSACELATMQDMFTQAQNAGVNFTEYYHDNETEPREFRVGSTENLFFDGVLKQPVLDLQLFDTVKGERMKIALKLNDEEKKAFKFEWVNWCPQNWCPFKNAVFPEDQTVPGEKLILAFCNLVAAAYGITLEELKSILLPNNNVGLEKPSSLNQDVSMDLDFDDDNNPTNELRVEEEVTSPKQEEKAATSSTLSAGAAAVTTTVNGTTTSTRAIGSSAASHILKRKVVEKPLSLSQAFSKKAKVSSPIFAKKPADNQNPSRIYWHSDKSTIELSRFLFSILEASFWLMCLLNFVRQISVGAIRCRVSSN